MKIIHIAGFSNTGKTTFILNFIPVLAKYGKIGVIKHLGHHRYETGKQGVKDTSRFFEADACFVAGIDDEKTVITVPYTSLGDVTALYAALGVEYVVIEGFKRIPCRKVWFGEREQAQEVGVLPYCILWNPTIDDVVHHLEEFDSWHPTLFDG
ncbi:MAG: molybdopterin-guanine dinucleotide biosynthesis protein MobB [Methanomicrobiales archaeon]|jgi:molybdopterin synthase catalytic subunit|nr:molybdopterin-guanine dinucleotide biosynthesis protein MobB [Methanomicrobiales archaeon]